MPTKQKRTISAKEILADIRSGMDEKDVKAKYLLSDKSFEKVRQKLVGVGALEASTEEKRKEASTKKRRPVPETAIRMVWKCPACGTPQPREYEECPQCGIITAKYTAQGNDDYRFSHESANYETESDTNIGNKVVVIAVSIVVFISLGAAFLKYTSNTEPDRTAVTKRSTPRSVQTFTSSNFENEALRVTEMHESNSTYEDEAPRVTERNESNPAPAKKKSTPGSVHTFTSSNFKERVVKASARMPVLVEFYTKRCPACKMMEPVLTSLARDGRQGDRREGWTSGKRSLHRLWHQRSTHHVYSSRW
jgi:Thioredoxin